MILMVRDYPTEYIIDNLEFARVEQLYYLTKDGEVYYREVFNGKLFSAIKSESVSVFMPRQEKNTRYQKEIFDDGKAKKEIEVCVATAINGFRKGERVSYVIHPSLNAYLCNDDGKTIRVIK